MKIGFKHTILLLTFIVITNFSCSKNTNETAQDPSQPETSQPISGTLPEQEATNSAHLTISEKVAKLDKNRKAQYETFDTEIQRLDEEIAKSSALKKVQLVKSREVMIQKRNDLLGE